MNYSYHFPAVKGLQAGNVFYTSMVPLKLLSRLFPSDEEYVAPEHRSQRKINETRIPVISQYILQNRDTYVFSALAASIDGDFSFRSGEQDPDVGILEVSMDARFLINDGQHRKAAIMKALAEDETLQNETIAVVFFEDHGLSRSQQMFTDLNKHAVKTSNSIAELYDSRDSLAVATREVVAAVPFLNMYTDREKDILGKYSSCLFTLSTFYNANRRIIHTLKATDEDRDFLIRYWETVCKNVSPWCELEKRQISKVDLRENYIVTQAVLIQVLGRLGSCFYDDRTLDMESCLHKLEAVNWKRTAPEWASRIIRSNGRMINNEEAIILTCNVLKQTLDLPLDRTESEKERGFTERG